MTEGFVTLETAKLLKEKGFGSMFFWDENWNYDTIISGSYHKATVEELINHFHNKC
jgi:hypothetical protein